MKYGFTVEGDLLKKYDAPILGCDDIVTIPDGITEIGKSAFYYIRGIGRVILPDSVRRIGEEAFYMCEGMKEIEMPSRLDVLGARAFAHCHTLERIVIPEGVTLISENTFYKCEKLTEVHLPRSLERIEPGAFSGAFLLRTVIFAGTAAEWQRVEGSRGYPVTCVAFDEQDKKATDPADFDIEDGVLTYYRGNASTVFVPDGVHTLAKDCFNGLWRDGKMYRLILPEGVDTVEEGAICHEELLSEIVIPKSLKSLSPYALSACFALERVIYGGTRAEWDAIRADMHFSQPCKVECADD